MTLAEAVAILEAGFQVSDEVGEPIDDRPGARRMDRAPNGDRYITMTSGGIRDDSEGPPALFLYEEDAIDAWLDMAQAYAKRRGGPALYWCERPVYEEAEFVGVSQAEMINSKVFAGALAIQMGTVQARFVVSKGTDRKEEG